MLVSYMQRNKENTIKTLILFIFFLYISPNTRLTMGAKNNKYLGLVMIDFKEYV